jgi:hypothetical protein
MSGGNLPPFMGYLPPVVDGTLLELMNMSYPDYPPRAGRTGAQLSESRLLALDSLRLFFKEKPHQRAAEIVGEAVLRQTPFCLYLRNFGLGPRVYGARNDPYGLPQVVTLAGQFDNHMQRRLQAAVEPSLPVVGIQNPAGQSGPLPAFVLADEDWESLAALLVRNAGMIVMHFLGFTSGVLKELELIRAAGKQTSTLVVIEQEDPFAALKDVALLTGARRQEPVSIAGSLDDFPHRLLRQGDDGWEAVQAKLAAMAREPHAPPVDRALSLPPEFLPPEPLRNYCTDRSTEEYDRAHQLMDEKRFDEAEDVLYRAVAYAHWARYPLGRVMTLTALGQLSLIGFGAKGDAGSLFEMALDTCKEFGRRVGRLPRCIRQSSRHWEACEQRRRPKGSARSTPPGSRASNRADGHRGRHQRSWRCDCHQRRDGQQHHGQPTFRSESEISATRPSRTSSPILNLQSADSFELANIRCNHHQPTRQPCASYQDIVSADWLTLGLERRTNCCGCLCISFIKRQRGDG